MTDPVIIDAYKHTLLTFSLLLPRMVAIFTILPFFSKLITGPVRNSVVAGFLIILYPMVEPTVPTENFAIWAVVGIIAKEIICGMLIGFLAAIPFWIAEGLGYFIDNQRGATMASVMDPMTGAQTSLYGSMFVQLCAVLFFTSGGFLLFLGGLFESYRLWPVTSFYPTIHPQFARFFLDQVDTLMRFVVIFAAPVVIALFVAEFGLGLINRFAPQLNVFFLSMPIKSGIASFLLVLYLGILAVFFKERFVELKTIFSFLGNLLGAPQ